MMVNEIAKFWNPPIARNSSWAYPSLCSCCSSSVSLGSGVGGACTRNNLLGIELRYSSPWDAS